MAKTTFSPTQLNEGILNSSPLPASKINFSFSNPSGSSYFCIETVTSISRYDSNSNKNCEGIWSVSSSIGLVTSSYIAGVVIQPGSSSIDFTPNSSISAGDIYFRGTGEYTLIITT